MTTTTGKQRVDKRPRRHAPYARPSATNCHAKTLTERVLGIYRQLSQPLLLGGRSRCRSSNDMFSVPWRTVDRETAALREQLAAEERIAAEIEEKRLADEEEEKEEAKKAADAAAVAAAAQAAAAAAAAAEEPLEEPLVMTPSAIEAKAVLEQETPAAEVDVEVEVEAAPETLAEPEPAVVEEVKPQYESVFETARRLAEERTTGIFRPTKLQPNPYITSRGSIQPKTSAATISSKGKGKEPETSRTPDSPAPAAPVGSVLPVESAEPAVSVDSVVAEAAYFEDEDSEEDCDFEPSSSTADDDEEEILQENMEPIDEQEEVMAISAGDVSPPLPVSERAETHLPESAAELEAQLLTEPIDSGDQSIEVSVIEESESEIEDAEVVLPEEIDEPQESSESQEIVETEEPPEVDDEEEEAEEVEVVVLDSEANTSSAESSQTTDERASATSEAESEAGPAMEGITPQLQSAPTSLSSRSWWPFGMHSLFSDRLQATQPPPLQLRKHAMDESESDADEHPAKARRRFMQSPRSPKHTVNISAQLQPRPFVPLSFVDISATGRSMRSLRNARRHASETQAAVSPVLASSPPKSKVHAKKPLITAQSLGLESRRSPRRATGRLLRKRPSLYYGSGYGSRSIPYAFTVSRSAPSAPVFTSPPGAVPSDTTQKSSITAQKILDIIGDTPAPPTRSQVAFDLHDTINPYDLASPQSLRAHPSTVQVKRRVLLPLSERLAKASTPPVTASPAKKRADASAASTKSLMESIQLAAPAEIQAKLAMAANRQPADSVSKTDAVTKKDMAKVDLPKESSSALKISRLFAKASEPPVATKLQQQAPAVLAPKGGSEKPLFSLKPAPTEATAPVAATTTERIAETPTKVPAKVPVPPVRSARAAALAVSEVQLPTYNFSLPACSAAKTLTDDQAKQSATRLDASQLPVFEFTIENSADSANAVVRGFGEFRPKPILMDAGEWECGMCDSMSPPSATRCAVCEASKPAAVAKLVSVLAAAPAVTSAAPASVAAPNLWAQSGFKMPTLKDGEWKCTVCDIKNSKDVSKCAACESPKPASASTAGPADTSAAPAPAAAPNLWAQSGFKMPTLKDGEWKCTVCDIKNSKDVSKCAACESPKPASASTAGPADTSAAPAPAAAPNLWAQSGFKMPTLKDGEWKCTVCDIKNSKDVSKCAACESPKPVLASTAAPAVTSAAPAPAAVQSSADLAKQNAGSVDVSQLPIFSFDLDVLKKPAAPFAPAAVPNLWAQSGFKMPVLKDGEWKCSICLVSNASSAKKCAACETPK